jgi:cytochrome c-type biogenesis protein CcmH
MIAPGALQRERPFSGRTTGAIRSAVVGVVRLLLALVAVLALSSAAFAIDPDEQLDDPALEARARELSKQLRCVICQSQSIDESNVSLARDLRVLVRERLVAGDTDQEILDYLADRYGDYVLLSPPVRGRTMLLWAGPLLFLALGAGVVLVVVRQAGRAPGAADDEDAGEGSAEGRA